VRLHHVAHDREPEAGAPGSSPCDEALEDPLALDRRDARPLSCTESRTHSPRRASAIRIAPPRGV
jgi:hypothetical protein